jgi:hypothetical protein
MMINAHRQENKVKNPDYVSMHAAGATWLTGTMISPKKPESKEKPRGSN